MFTTTTTTTNNVRDLNIELEWCILETENITVKEYQLQQKI